MLLGPWPYGIGNCTCGKIKKWQNKNSLKDIENNSIQNTKCNFFCTLLQNM